MQKVDAAQPSSFTLYNPQSLSNSLWGGLESEPEPSHVAQSYIDRTDWLTGLEHQTSQLNWKWTGLSCELLEFRAEARTALEKEQLNLNNWG